MFNLECIAMEKIVALFEKILDPTGHYQRAGCDMEVVRQAVGPVPEMVQFEFPRFKEQVQHHCETRRNFLWQFDFITKSLHYNGKTLYPYAAVINEKENLFIYDKNLIVFTNAFMTTPDYKEVYSIHPKEVSVNVSGGIPPR